MARPIRRVCITGTGAWGTALALLFARTASQTVMLTRTDEEAHELNDARENRRFLPGARFPDTLSATADPALGLAGAELVVFAVPAQSMRQNVERVRDLLPSATPIVSASKGIERSSGLRMSEVMSECVSAAEHPVLVLSGPNLSREVVAGLPAATVVASDPDHAADAEAAQALLSSDYFRVYTSTDLPGVELGGSMKNVIAIATGICDGLGYGHNARAGLVTRGLAEMTRLAVAGGGRATTLAGLSGLGDLMTTVASTDSRNYSLGFALGSGESLAAFVARSVHIAEGVETTGAALTLATRLGVELPITAQLAAVFAGDCTAEEGSRLLMRRALGPE